ncbi:hypothetical protein, partial [Desulfovibrio sp.]|uniref:hypothetical protein n=1 Tax=Desulfovibrio sp. TaxID=885 RepID=UPI003AAB0E20
LIHNAFLHLFHLKNSQLALGGGKCHPFYAGNRPVPAAVMLNIRLHFRWRFPQVRAAKPNFSGVSATRQVRRAAKDYRIFFFLSGHTDRYVQAKPFVPVQFRQRP